MDKEPGHINIYVDQRQTSILSDLNACPFARAQDPFICKNIRSPRDLFEFLFLSSS